MPTRTCAGWCRSRTTRCSWPGRARHLALEVFARSFFADPHDFSAGELVAMFHTYFVGSAEGLLFDVPDDDYTVPIGPAQERAEVGTNVIVSAIRDFVVAWRSVWTDREAQQEMITRVYRMLVPASEPEAQISRWYNDNNPFDNDEGTRVTVEIGRIQVISARVLTIEWTESHRHPGSPTESRRFSAHIEVEFAARATMERVSGNPLGVYLHAISVTRQ